MQGEVPFHITLWRLWWILTGEGSVQLAWLSKLWIWSKLASNINHFTSEAIQGKLVCLFVFQAEIVSFHRGEKKHAMPFLEAKFPHLDMALFPIFYWLWKENHTVKSNINGLEVLSSFHVKGGCEYLPNNNIINHILQNYYLSVPPQSIYSISSKEKKNEQD